MARPTRRPLVFGEVLFDRFEDGGAVLGGAPFNVAWHLQGFGHAPLFVSRVGDDEAGRQILEQMHAWRMDTRGVQLDSHHPTGSVNVRLRDGQPSYDIVPDQAYDHVAREPLSALLSEVECSLLYHGTLAARQPVSRDTLFGLTAEGDLPVFVDVNLREPWWDTLLVERALRGATWIKLNDDELETLSDGDAYDLQAEAETLRRNAGARLLIVTRGAAGACLADAGGVACHGPPPVHDVVDTVGAGDAFSAVVIFGLDQGWSTPQILHRALAFAAAICRQRGATAADPALYQRFMDQWNNG